MIAIADSSALISGFVQSDSNHKEAKKFQNELKSNLVTIYIPSEIFSETLNTIGKKINHQAALKFAEVISSVEIFQVIESDENIRQYAIEKLANQPESVSYTDCLVMAFADHFETKTIFGFDKSFTQSGYKLI